MIAWKVRSVLVRVEKYIGLASLFLGMLVIAFILIIW